MAAIRDNFSLVSKLHHPNIASLLHLHRVEFVDDRAQAALGVRSNDYLVVMEYAPGVTLFAVRRALPEQKLPVEQALEICRPIADALDYAHSQRILHRDVKPKNIMVAMQPEVRGSRSEGSGAASSNKCLITNNQTVKVLDFGLAAEIRSSMSRKSKDPQNSKSGTPLYMAPEQWRGIRQSAATDQYALAVLFYELVSGAIPFKSAFDSGSFEIMRSVVLTEPAPKLKELTKKQNAVLLQALSKNPEDRFSSCIDFVNALAGRGGQRGGGGSSNWTLAILFGLLVAASIFGFSRSSDTKVGVQWTARQTGTLKEKASPEQSFREHRQIIDAATEKKKLEEAEKNREKEVENERKVILRYAKVSVAHKKAIQLDRGQGFGEKLDAMEEKWFEAEAFQKSKVWDQALLAYDAAEKLCKDLLAAEALRYPASEKHKELLDILKRAKQAGASYLNPASWHAAVELSKNAEKAFERGEFTTALNGIKKAIDQLYTLTEKAEQRLQEERLAQEAKTKEQKNSPPPVKPIKSHTVALNDSVFMDFVWIPPGTFRMGSPANEIGRDRDESLRTLRINTGFWMASTETTLAQFAVYLKEQGTTTQKALDWNDPDVPLKMTETGFDLVGNDAGSDWKQPVVEITFNEALRFCNWLTSRAKESGLTGYRCQLPTEAYWEYACRAGTSGSYSGGELSEMGWYNLNSRGKSHPVGAKWPNRWGLYDMHGNVWEWCVSSSGGSGGVQPMRGGSWSDTDIYCRSANRAQFHSADSENILGFRVIWVRE